MGIIGDLKKMFFGASSLAKSAASHTEEFIKEETEELVDKAKEFGQKSADSIATKTAGLKESIMENSKELLEKAKEKVTELSHSPMVEKLEEVSENIGGSLIEKGNDVAEKAAKISENVGAKIIKKGDELLEKSQTLSENIGEKLSDVKDDLVEKAKDLAEKAGDRFNETLEKAKAWEAEEAAKPKREFAEETLTAGKSLLEDKDDFFTKADKFASGDYDAFSEGKITIQKPTGTQKNKPTEKATGFDDLDGDGNEIIDDAIISPE